MPLGWMIGAALAAAAAALLWWIRSRKVEAQREALRGFYGLSEDIIAAPTPSAIAERLTAVLPAVIEASVVNLYLYERHNNALERVPTSAEPEPMVAPLDDPPEGLANAAVMCFRNRAPLSIPDVRGNPLVNTGSKMSLPRAAIFVPLISQQEVLGVLEAGNTRSTGFFSPEDQAALQHLANQAAASLNLQERRAMREQIFHSEKLAATGQLISGFASELRAPLQDIERLAAALAHRESAPPRGELLRLWNESQRASEIVGRLVSFAGEAETAPRLVDVNAVAAGLIRFREPEWRLLGLRSQERLSPQAAPVAGSRGQLEQVLLNLLVHAEQHAAESPAKFLSIQSSVIAGGILIEIGFSVPPPAAGGDGSSPTGALGEGAFGLGVCQGIARSHGGEIRFRSDSATARFELEFPLEDSPGHSAASSQILRPSRALTLLLVSMEPGEQKQLLGLLSLRGHRAIPVGTKESTDLVQRLRFDAVFLNLHANGGNWLESRESVREHVPVYILLSDGHDADLARRIEQDRGLLLPRPFQELELDRVLAEVETRSGSRSY